MAKPGTLTGKVHKTTELQKSQPTSTSTFFFIYYLPHHAVVREEAATTKVRVVFDASAYMRECKSLNVLNPGPSLLPDLIALLLRFREYEFALQVDIRKAVGVPEKDRLYLRFLWPNLRVK